VDAANCTLRSAVRAGIVNPVHRISVLVVDDHQVFADALQARLAAEDLLGPVAVAYSAGEALARLERTPFDILIADFLLDGETGAELATQAREVAPNTRIIMLSATKDLDCVVDSLIAGASSWLPKTIDTEYLIQAIQGVHSGEMWIDRALLGRAMPAVLARILEPSEDPLAVLTAREREVLDCMIAGLSRSEIAARLHVSGNTVRTHTQNLISKLGTHSALEAVTLALRSGHYPT
jgi:DNA-binding NarL/FixJ family response regulator